MLFRDDIHVQSNVFLCMRERGKLVPGSTREGHNVFTNTGRNLLSKLIAWKTLGSTDLAFTEKRLRWMGMGSGTQLEVANVSQLNSPVLITPSRYLVEIQSTEHPTSTTARIICIFGVSDITFSQGVVELSEVGAYADVNPADSAGDEDSAAPGFTTALDPSIGTNAPSAYKAFEPINKTADYTIEVRWDFRIV